MMYVLNHEKCIIHFFLGGGGGFVNIDFSFQYKKNSFVYIIDVLVLCIFIMHI